MPLSAPAAGTNGTLSLPPSLWRRIGEKTMTSVRGLREYVKALPVGLRTESVHQIFVRIVGRPAAAGYQTQAPTVTAWAATQGVELRESFGRIARSANPPGVSSAWPAGFEQRPAPTEPADTAVEEADSSIDLRSEVPAEQVTELRQTVQQQGDIIARQDATLQNYHRIITDQAAVIDRQAEQLRRNEELIVRMDQRLTAQDELLARAVESAAIGNTARKPAAQSGSGGGRHARPDAGGEAAVELPNVPLSPLRNPSVRSRSTLAPSALWLP
ncbi:hypothetical protein [Fodinicola feengrottensis]|uniref:hypothetical protein n=1 Tax=Fodinicola feengrottensis TaxID=435914 RepID=UPI0013D4F020|nr:hypothetical protein [Fodinicola feengrottensis]